LQTDSADLDKIVHARQDKKAQPKELGELGIIFSRWFSDFFNAAQLYNKTCPEDEHGEHGHMLKGLIGCLGRLKVSLKTCPQEQGVYDKDGCKANGKDNEGRGSSYGCPIAKSEGNFIHFHFSFNMVF
jgi:hypothetical protein